MLAEDLLLGTSCGGRRGALAVFLPTTVFILAPGSVAFNPTDAIRLRGLEADTLLDWGNALLRSSVEPSKVAGAVG